LDIHFVSLKKWGCYEKYHFFDQFNRPPEKNHSAIAGPEQAGETFHKTMHHADIIAIRNGLPDVIQIFTNW
jgi:hypothetical protein